LIAKYNLFIEKYRLTNYKAGDLVVCKVTSSLSLYIFVSRLIQQQIDETAVFVRVHNINNITMQVQVLSSPKEAIVAYPMSQIYALPPEVGLLKNNYNK